MRQNKIDCFEHLRSDFDEYEHLICSDSDEFKRLIRSECVFLIGRRSDECQLMKVMIEMLEMTMTMIIELTIAELRMIVICSFEFECLGTISRMLFQLFEFDSTFSQRSSSLSRSYT